MKSITIKLNIIVYSILGLDVSALSFALHLFFIRKKLIKPRGRRTDTVARRTHRTTVFTSEGISGTCNTDCPLLSESM